MRKALIPSLAVVIALALVAPAAAQDAERKTTGELKNATELLRLSFEEWLREDGAYRTVRDAGKVSAAEAAEHAGFVAGLRLRVLRQCETVRGLGGEDALREFECVRFSPQGGETLAMVPSTAVLTEEEKKAALEARLNELEGDVDGTLQKRQQEIRQKAGAASARAAAGGGAGAGAGGGAGAGAGTSSASPGSTWGPPPPEGAGKPGSEGERPASAGSNAGRPGTSSSTGVPASGRSAQRQTASDGGSDDDVVARQLREAAEKETDPVLKEKLWDEYRKYKEGKK